MANDVIRGDGDEIQTFEKIGKVMAEIEVSKQKTALAQIEATREDNQRQYDFALDKLNKEYKKWHKSTNIASIAVFILLALSIYFLIVGRTDLGLGLLSTILAGVFGYLAGMGSSKT